MQPVSQQPCDEDCSEVSSLSFFLFPSLLTLDIYNPPEHLGLIPPQFSKDDKPTVTPSMRPAPYPHEDDYATRDLDELVMDPVGESTLRLWNDTARKNREVFTEIFRPVPTNLVRNWSAYEVCCAFFVFVLF